jgi:hypothetical protein
VGLIGDVNALVAKTIGKVFVFKPPKAKGCNPKSSVPGAKDPQFGWMVSVRKQAHRRHSFRIMKASSMIRFLKFSKLKRSLTTAPQSTSVCIHLQSTACGFHYGQWVPAHAVALIVLYVCAGTLKNNKRATFYLPANAKPRTATEVGIDYL